jgi:FkbM family methyltransferase
MGFLGDQKYALQIGVETSKASPPLSRLWTTAVGAVMPLKARFAPDRPMHLKLITPGGGRRRFVVDRQSDLQVLSDVFVEGQYAQPRVAGAPVIVDAGSHIGASVVYFALTYPKSRILAIEGSPSTFEKLQANTRDLPNVELINAALAPEDGEVSFYERPEGWTSSIDDDGRGGSKVTVAAVSLRSVLERVGGRIDLLKMDIEGAEFAVLAAHRPNTGEIGAIVGEIHSWLPGSHFTDAEFLELLNGYQVETDTSGRDYVFRAVTA